MAPTSKLNSSSFSESDKDFFFVSNLHLSALRISSPCYQLSLDFRTETLKALFHLIHISAKNPQLFSPKAPYSTYVSQTTCGVLIRRAAYFDLAITAAMSAPRDQQKELRPWSEKYLNPQAWREEKLSHRREKLSQRRYEILEENLIDGSKKRTLNEKQLCYELASDRRREKKNLILM
jgi:hypothetical protein